MADGWSRTNYRWLTAFCKVVEYIECEKGRKIKAALSVKIVWKIKKKYYIVLNI